MSSTKRPDTVLALADGRRLGYAEFGDPSGAPCLYFHFSPGSRLEPAAVFSGVRQAWLRGVRLVSADRPGFGLSDRQPARTLLDWPGDIAALADHLGIDRFAVLGASGGGAYALACAGCSRLGSPRPWWSAAWDRWTGPARRPAWPSPIGCCMALVAGRRCCSKQYPG